MRKRGKARKKEGKPETVAKERYVKKNLRERIDQ